jgi:hypothetical protein
MWVELGHGERVHACVGEQLAEHLSARRQRWDDATIRVLRQRRVEKVDQIDVEGLLRIRANLRLGILPRSGRSTGIPAGTNRDLIAPAHLRCRSPPSPLRRFANVRIGHEEIRWLLLIRLAPGSGIFSRKVPSGLRVQSGRPRRGVSQSRPSALADRYCRSAPGPERHGHRGLRQRKDPHDLHIIETPAAAEA